jgi:hypothetical protein
MNLLNIAVGIFVLLELSNIFALYFRPTTKHANAIGMFKAWEKSKNDPEVHSLVRYLVYWVAGSKLIFIGLIFVIFVFGDELTKVISVVALILSISTFYWKLFPLIRDMDNKGEISPKGYSKTLAVMILMFILVLGSVLLYTLIA